MNPSTPRELVAIIGSALAQLYADGNEGKAVAELLLMNVFNTNRIGLYGIDEKITDKVILDNIQSAFNRLLNHEPIQYILGETIFYGLNISVAKDVLIPRHETEELAEWLIGAHEFEQETIDIIDIGCGSGCLSVAIKNNLPRATVSGIDVSEAALELSKINAKKHNLDICFKLQNIFDDNFKWDSEKELIVVSNPPYVLESEKPSLSERVKLHEPSMALFVPDDDPLRFYKRILELFATQAKMFYFEINPLLADNFMILANDFGLNSEIRKDFFGRFRMCRIYK